MKNPLISNLIQNLRLFVWQNLARGFHTVDQVLRRGHSSDSSQVSKHQIGGSSFGPESHRVGLSMRTVIAVVLIVGPIYGMAMGSYAAVTGQRSWLEQIPQMVYSASKVPILIAVTLFVSIPSFFVINSLFGLRDNFVEAMRAIISAQAGLTIILCSLFPLVLFLYMSLDGSELSYSVAVLVNAAAFGLASISAQWLLSRYYQPLIQQNARHLWMIRLWIMTYAFIGIQTAYVLRPFIGDPDLSTTFLRRDSFQNAYVKIIELVGNTLGL